MSRKFSNLEVPKQLITITQSHEQNYKNSIGDPQLFHGKTNQSRIFQVYDPPWGDEDFRQRSRREKTWELSTYQPSTFPDHIDSAVYGRPGFFSLCRIVNLETVMGHRTKRFFQWSGKMGERFWKPKGLGMIGKMGWIFRSGFSLYMAYICFTFEGLFFGYSGDCFTSGLQMGLKRPGRVLFSAVWPFYGWVDGFCYMMVWTAVWPFFCAYF